METGDVVCGLKRATQPKVCNTLLLVNSIARTRPFAGLRGEGERPEISTIDIIKEFFLGIDVSSLKKKGVGTSNNHSRMEVTVKGIQLTRAPSFSLGCVSREGGSVICRRAGPRRMSRSRHASHENAYRAAGTSRDAEQVACIAGPIYDPWRRGIGHARPCASPHGPLGESMSSILRQRDAAQRSMAISSSPTVYNGVSVDANGERSRWGAGIEKFLPSAARTARYSSSATS